MSRYDYHRVGIYRSRDKIIAGVCGGIAEYFDFSAFWVRFVAVVALICTGIWPTLVVYFIAAMMMKRESYVRWES